MDENKKFCTVCGKSLDESGICPDCESSPDELHIPAVKEEAADVKEPTVAMPRIQDFEESEPSEKIVDGETYETPDELYIPSVKDEAADVKEPAVAMPQLRDYDESAYSEPSAPEIVEPEISVDEDGAAEIIYNDREKPRKHIERKSVQQPERRIEPSGFALTITQAMRVIKFFFSRNVLDAVTDQYREKLPIWTILLCVSSLVISLSMTLSYSMTDGRSLGAGNVFTSFDMNGVETFFVALALSIGTLITYSLAMRQYLKAIGVETRFGACANLVTAAYIPVVLGYIVNIISFGYISAAGFDMGQLGFAFFAILLFIGVRRITNGRKPLWSFMLALLCAAVASILVGLIVASPIIVTRGLMSMAETPVA